MNNPENYTEAEQQASEPDFYGKWTERSKRNPKERGEYLVYRAEVFIMEFANFGTSKGWDNGRYKHGHNYRVTHWMKKPEPPKD